MMQWLKFKNKNENSFIKCRFKWFVCLHFSEIWPPVVWNSTKDFNLKKQWLLTTRICDQIVTWNPRLIFYKVWMLWSRPHHDIWTWSYSRYKELWNWICHYPLFMSTIQQRRQWLSLCACLFAHFHSINWMKGCCCITQVATRCLNDLQSLFRQSLHFHCIKLIIHISI